MAITSVLPQIEEPEPITPISVKKVIGERRVIKFDTTQRALREICAKGYGILAEKRESGFCALIVNRCYDFSEVLTWMQQLETPAVE